MSKYLAITGDINTNTYSNALRFVEETLKEGTKDIVIIINSTGGSVDNGFAIYDLIKSINYSHITTIAIGTCASIATILFALGDTRLIAPNAIYVLHSASVRFNNGANMNVADAKELLEDLQKDNERIFSALDVASPTTSSSNYIKEVLSSGKDYKLDANEVVNKGFATDFLADFPKENFNSIY